MVLKLAFPAPTGVPLSSLDNRADLAGLVLRTIAGVPRAGILPRHTTVLATARASMGIDVASFEAVLVRNGLPSFIQNDGTVTVPIGSPPVANARYDVVYAKQNEMASPFSDANNNPILDFVSGPASASPSESGALALVPAGGLPIATVYIPSTATTTQSAGVVVKQVFPYTALTGGTLWVRLTAELTALTGFALATLAWSLESGLTYRWDGSAWVRVASTLDSGWITPTLSGAWVDQGGSFLARGARRIGTRVQLCGSVKNGALGVIMNLPVGFRPTGQCFFLAPCNGGALQVYVTAAGDVVAVSYIAGGTNAIVGLDNISFFTD